MYNDSMPTLEEVLRATSRTFAIGIEGLPNPLREEMRVSYLILRVSDYLEDNTTLLQKEKAALLELWAAVLEGGPLDSALLSHLRTTADPSPDSVAAHHAPQIVEALQALSTLAQAPIRAHTRDSTLGMARWVLRGPDIGTELDLDDYMHEVAGRVGYLITDLFSIASGKVRENREEMMALGRDFGLALQTVNIVRGIPADIERGWFFVPRAFLPDSITSGRDFLEEVNRPEAVLIVERLLVKATRHFEAAEEYITKLPSLQGKMRYFCLLPYFFGVRTLALSKENPEVLTAEVKLRREEVRAIAWRTRLLGWSNRWIRSYSADLANTHHSPARYSPAK